MDERLGEGIPDICHFFAQPQLEAMKFLHKKVWGAKWWENVGLERRKFLDKEYVSNEPRYYFEGAQL